MQPRNADGSGARDLRPELPNHMIEALGALWTNDGSGLLAKEQQVQGDRGLVWIPTYGGPIVAFPKGSSIPCNGRRLSQLPHPQARSLPHFQTMIAGTRTATKAQKLRNNIALLHEKRRCYCTASGAAG